MRNFLLSPFSIVLLGTVSAALAQTGASSINRLPVNQWTPTGSLSVARSGACTATLPNGQVLIAGGAGLSGALYNVDLYDPESGTFYATSPLRQARRQAACTPLPNGRVLIAGGNDGSNSLDSVEFYDPQAGVWTPAGRLNRPRSGSQAVLLPGGGVLFAGGVNNGDPVAEIEVYDPASGKMADVGRLSTARAGMKARSLPDGRVLFIGGRDSVGVRNIVEVFNGRTGEVSTAGFLLTGRANFAATLLNDGTVLITGGMDAEGNTLASAEVFDPSSGVAIEAGSMNEARSDHVARVLPNNGGVLIVGGMNGNHGLKSSEVYMPWMRGFHRTEDLSVSRLAAAEVFRPGALLLVGGAESGKITDTADLYRFATVTTQRASDSTITAKGDGWAPGEMVQIVLSSRGTILARLGAKADDSGRILVSGIQLPENADLLVVGGQSQARTQAPTHTSQIDINDVSPASPAPQGSSVSISLGIADLQNSSSFPSGTTVAVTVDGTPLGTVSVENIDNDGIIRGNATVNFDGGAFPLLAVGTHTLIFTFHDPGGLVADAVTSTSYTINAGLPAPTFTVSAAASVPAFQALTVTITGIAAGLNTPSGSVTLLVDGSSAGSGNLASGIATVTLAGGLAGGSHTLGVDYAGDSNFGTLTDGNLGSITVTKLTPVVTWTIPPAITYGTALGGAQLSASSTVAGTFVYTPASGAVLAAGSHTLSVTFTPTDSTSYNAPAAVQVTIDVNKATPTITWSTPDDIAYLTPLSATQLNATASTPGTFVYTPVSGTVLDAGNRRLSVDFTPTDADNYVSTSAEVFINVTKANPVITWNNPPNITYPAPLGASQLNAIASVPGSFVYVPPTGTVLDAGSRTLAATFTPDDTTNYAGANPQVTIVVDKATPPITWNAPADIPYGTALSATQLNASSTYDGTFVYTPTTGTVLEVGSHSLSVTFTPTNPSVNPVTTQANLVVTQATPTITWTAPAAITYGTALSGTQLNATASVPGTFVYSPTSGATPGAGSQTLSVTFTPTDGTRYTTTTAEVTLTVNKALPTLTWTSPAAITYGTPLSATQLSATASVPGTFVFTPSAGTILDSGNRTLSAAFTPTDGDNYLTATATTEVVVNKATPQISWTTPAAIAYGTALSATQLNATSNVPGTFEYTPALGTILDVSEGGHKLVVNFTPTSPNYEMRSYGVRLDVNPATPELTWAPEGPITYPTPLGPSQLNAASTVAGTFTYQQALGTVLEPGINTLSVHFTPTSGNYVAADKSVSFRVTAASTAVSWPTPQPITYGTPLSFRELNADANAPGGSFTYSPSHGTILPAGHHTLQVTFVPSDPRYGSSTGSVVLTVNKATPPVTWTNPADIVYGTPIGAAQLNAAPALPGVLTYSPAAGTILKAGKHVLAATFLPADSMNYEAVTVAAELTVNRAAPTLTWPVVPPMPSGATLCANQLNATANVPGTFTYDPPFGAVLAGGSHTLTVTFTPADSENYVRASATSTLVVADGETNLAPVNGAGFQAMSLAPNALFTIFGTNLGDTATATGWPLPTTLGGVSLTLVDAKGASWQLLMIYASARQVNFQVPPGPAAGPAKLTFSNARGALVVIETSVAGVAPGLFTADLSGSGPAAGNVTVRSAGGATTSSALAACSSGHCTTVPFNLGSATDEVTLVLPGTGFRAAAIADITVTIGGERAELRALTPVEGSNGVDQLVVVVPRSLGGRGVVDLVAIVSGHSSNSVQIAIQ